MSLYVGHLSPHVQPDELERVFRRFGRCSFQLKDGYGFVVYEVTANAERALRALRGKQVCGEQISLNWSNKQPRTFQRPPRGSRFDEPFRRRIFREEENASGFRNSQDRREFPTDVPLPTYNHGRRRGDTAADREAGHTNEDADSVRGNKGENLTDMLMNDEDADELNSLEHDRWRERTSDSLPSHEVGRGSDFDRYEPYHGYDKRGERDGNWRGSSDSSPYRDPHGKGKYFNTEAERKFDKSIPPLTCYNCGQEGHIKRKCPEGDGRRDRFTKFEQMRDEMGFRERMEGRIKKFRANSWGRSSMSRDPFVPRHRTWDRKELHSNNVGKSSRTRSPPEIKEKHVSKPRSKSQSKKGTKKKYLSKKRAGKKKTQKSDSSSTSSDSSKSSSGQSKSRSISDTRSHSTSRSGSSRSGSSATSRSRSISISSYAKSKSSRSRSRSRPMSRSSPDKSLSLSVSLGPKSSSSPKNKEIYNSISTVMKENSEHTESTKPKPFSKMKNSGEKTFEDENAPASLGVKVQPNVEYAGKNNGNARKSDLEEVGYNETDACFDVINGASSAYEDLPETSARHGSLTMKPVKQLSDSTGISGISTGEMFSALHHYGLVSPKEDGGDVTVESYLGAARLWPWEMIYYRRLKRGPISTDNYARRLEQNKEFGIVDKYIRSSSSWGERHRDA